jgi:RNA polymerase-binding transcription factor DksA
VPGVSRFCIDCDAPIPPARRAPFRRAVLRHLSGNRRAERQTLQRGCCMSTS